MPKIGSDAQGNDVYTTCSHPGSCAGADFIIVIEARAGTSGKSPGTIKFNSNLNDPTARPDVQLESNHNMGNGSTAVCDNGPAPDFPLGGVPGINPPNYDLTSQAIANALNDLGCRFDSHTAADPCTLNSNDNPQLANPTMSTVQFCTAGVVGHELLLPNGDTLFTVQWRDTGGNLSLQHRMVVRVP